MTTFVLILAWLGVLWGAVLSFLFWRNPEEGMRITTHHLKELPKVMADRFTGITIIAAAVAWSGILWLIAIVFFASAVMAFSDAWIYRQAGYSWWKHAATGVFTSVGALAALIAMA